MPVKEKDRFFLNFQFFARVSLVFYLEEVGDWSTFDRFLLLGIIVSQLIVVILIPLIIRSIIFFPLTVDSFVFNDDLCSRPTKSYESRESEDGIKDLLQKFLCRLICMTIKEKEKVSS